MSNGANLSIMGLYNYDDTVLDMMAFPEGFTDAQKQNVKENILIECAELEFLYPAPEVAKNIIGIWSRKELPYWTRVYNASLAKYDPIENYRRNETETISDGKTEEHSGSDVSRASGTDSLSRTGADTNRATGSDTLARTGTDTSTASGSDTNTGNSSTTDQESGTDTVTNKITGFDSNTLVNHDSSDTVYGHKNTNTANGTNTQTYGRKDTVEHNTSDSTTYGKQETYVHNTIDSTLYGKTDTLQHGEKILHSGNTSRNMLAYGNIGVTTSQEMLTQELEIAKIIEVVPIIIESFKNRFCLMVY